MRIALLGPTPVPRAYGGMDRFLAGLAEALRRRHPTDLVTLPVDERSAEGVLKGYYDFYHLDVSDYDLVISTKAPSFMVRHPIHVSYLNHRLRVFYDRYRPGDDQQARMRRLIHWMDHAALQPERTARLFTIGHTVRRRLQRWGGLKAAVVHHPTTFQPAAPQPGRYFLAPGRLHAWKRVDLIVEAMKRSRAETELRVTGTGPEAEQLERQAGGDPRIRFLGHLSEEELAEAYAGAIATLFTPIQEDLGLVTFESFLGEKPVITTADAGEPAEIVEHERTGLIAEPTPEALARCMNRLAAHPDQAAAMGRAGRPVAEAVTWDGVVEVLLGAAEHIRRERRPRSRHTRSGDGRYHLLVTDNQMVDPPVGGGRVRIWELFRHLPDEFVTTYLGTHDHPGPLFRDQWLAPNFREIVMPLTTVHFKAHELWRRLTRGDATIDVTIPLLLGRCSPRYRRLLAEHLSGCDLLVCEHPWMWPFLPNGSVLPRIYDAQNCEAAVKTPLLSRTLAGRYLARQVERIERRAVSDSDLVVACSPSDVEQLERRYGCGAERIHLAPNGVDCREIQPAEPEAKPRLRRRLGLPAAGPLAVFTGSRYEPNLQAVEFIIDRLAPVFPEVVFVVVGSVGPMWRERHTGDPPGHVRLLGEITSDRLIAAYQAADLGLNPMLQGSGTNIKMLDYMAAGLAILTTPVGARGLAGRDGEHWRLAEVDHFEGALRQMLEAAGFRRELGARARGLAESRYDWVAIGAELGRRLTDLLDARGRNGRAG